MTTTTTFESRMERIAGGERLSADEIRELAATPDVLPLGMLADALRRRLRGTTATYVRVAECAVDGTFEGVPSGAKEIRITGAPQSLEVALDAVTRATASAAGRTVSGFSWAIVEHVAGGSAHQRTDALARLKDAGLDAVAELALDAIADPADAIGCVTRAGFDRLRLTIDKAGAADRTGLLLLASALQEEYGSIQSLNPLPMALHAFRPTTGYDDVKMVAIARLAAPNIPTIQVDWARYGPKLAQVALTFGADDVYGISGSDAAPEGRRRAAVEEISRNIEAAGFEAVERDGRYREI